MLQQERLFINSAQLKDHAAAEGAVHKLCTIKDHAAAEEADHKLCIIRWSGCSRRG
jgi:hypothetical protein